MKIKKLLLSLLAITAMLTSFFALSPLASAAENPYNYSSEPTRAIYYVLPTMKGNDVKWVQSALNAYGNYGLDIDGSFGPACKEATRKFQASRGLSQDGSFGPATRASMVSWLNQNGYSSNVNQKPSSVTYYPDGSTSVKYSNAISPSGKAFYTQSSGGCYTASCAMIMSNLNASWNGVSATYWNVYAANGGSAYLSGATPGKFGCRRTELAVSKASVVDAIKKYPQGVMVAFYQPNKGWNHCMAAVGLNSSGEPLFFDPSISDGSNNGNGRTLEQTPTGSNYGGATWNNLVQVSAITR